MDIQKLVRYAKTIPDFQDPKIWGSPLEQKYLDEVESSIGIRFPDDFREFIMDYNGACVPDYIYHVRIAGPEGMDLRGIYRDEHATVENPMPLSLVPFSPDGWGNHYCFHKSQPGICFWQHDMDAGALNPKMTNDSFTAWFKEKIDEYIKHGS